MKYNKPVDVGEVAHDMWDMIFSILDREQIADPDVAQILTLIGKECSDWVQGYKDEIEE